MSYRSQLYLYITRRLMTRENLYIAAIAAVVLFGLALRLLAALVWNGYQPDTSQRLGGDEPGYDNLAREMLQGFGFTWPGRVPLYPLWLAGVYLATGGSYDAVPYFQAFLGAATVWLTYLLARRYFDRRASLLAAFFAAASYVLIHQSLHLLSEVLFTPLVLIAVIALVDALRKPAAASFGVAGLWVGLSNLARPTLLLFPVAAVFLLIPVLGKRRGTRSWLIYLAASILVIAPWIARNYVRYGALFPLQTSNAILWQGSPEYYHLIRDQGYTYIRIWSEILYGPGWEARDPTSVEGDRYWTGRALRSIAREPAVYVRYAMEKLVTYWLGDPNADWGNSSIFDYHALRDIGFSPPDALQFMLARVLPILGLLSAVVLRGKAKWLWPVYFLLVYVTLLHAATHAEARLSDPFQPFLLVLIAGAIVSILRRWLPSRRIPAAEAGQ